MVALEHRAAATIVDDAELPGDTAVNDTDVPDRPLRLRLTALGCLVKAEFLLGDGAESLTHGEFAASPAEDAEHVEAAQSAAVELDIDHDRAYAAWARAPGLRPRGRGRCRRRDRTGSGAARQGLVRRATVARALRRRPGDPGRFDQAAVELDAFEELVRSRGSRTSLAGTLTIRARLASARADDAAARAALDEGLERLDGLATPFLRAQLEQAYGAHLHQQGARRDAAARLESARQAFDVLGAEPYLARCERELAACARHPRRRSAPGAPVLTAQETAVARLVAEGYTNRQAAADLVVSVKTVEYHLGNIVTKLGLRSRSQLAARFAGAAAQPR